MAIGMSVQGAYALCAEERFAGRVQVAAVNSSSSITLSGDEDAIDGAEQGFKISRHLRSEAEGRYDISQCSYDKLRSALS